MVTIATQRYSSLFSKFVVFPVEYMYTYIYIYIYISHRECCNELNSH